MIHTTAEKIIANIQKVIIGKDTRVSGYLLESAMEAGLISSGVDVRLLGPMPTPGIAYLTRTARAQAGVVIPPGFSAAVERGEVAEGSRSNVFVEAGDGVLLTPPLTSKVL